MAVEFTLFCDDCGLKVATSKVSERDVRAHAQMDGKVYCGKRGARRVDRCRSCTRQHDAEAQGNALKGAPSVGTQR